MQIHKTLLFILSCTILVALLAFIFPKNGITIFGLHLRYADANKILASETELKTDIHEEFQAISDANKIRQHIATKKNNICKVRQLKLTSLPCAIDFPNNDIRWFDSVFIALEKSKTQTMRVLHFGDSQIEEDRMTGTIRHYLQNRFGGFGAGLVPALQTIPSSAIAQRSYGNNKRYVVFGTKNLHHKKGHYGPTGQMITIDNKYCSSFYSINLNTTKANTKKFKNISILYGNNSSNLAITLSATSINDSIIFKDTVNVSDSNMGLNFATFNIPFESNDANICIEGICELYGYLLDGENIGVQVDNIPMRGCSGLVFTNIEQSTILPLFEEYHIPLIIMQYGGNSVPYLNGGKSINYYCYQISQQIKHIKKLAPNSKIMFIGPSDMGTSIDGEMQTYPELPQIINSLKEICLSNNVAYWDLYTAMGGYNSMLSWVEASPALAGSDYVHFTTLGSHTAAKMLCNHIDELYKYFIERKNNNYE